jgi:aryl-alcohol dehydrogenase-like predicted oxidoreductase
MQTVRLGRTGVTVSVAGLGCGGASRLGMAYGKDVEHAAGVVRRALDLGVTFIDTAQAYGTEEAVGKGVAGRREEVFISSKVSPGWGEELLTPQNLVKALDGSLRRLGTDRIDLYHLHGVRLAQYGYCIESLLPELERQQAAGKIRFLGITEQFGRDTRHEMLERALPDSPFDVVMVGFSLLNPSARRTVFPLTREREVGTLIMFAVRRALSHPEALKEMVAGLVAEGAVDPGKVNAGDPLDFVRESAGVASITEAAYRFCRHEPGADVVLTGTGDPAHLEENLRAIQGPPLAPALQARLADIFGAVDSVSGN